MPTVKLFHLSQILFVSCLRPLLYWKAHWYIYMFAGLLYLAGTACWLKYDNIRIPEIVNLPRPMHGMVKGIMSRKARYGRYGVRLHQACRWCYCVGLALQLLSILWGAH